MKPDSPFFLVSGPCVIEDETVTLRIAARLKAMTESLGIPFTFKASYDKANRTAITSFRGPGHDARIANTRQSQRDP
jgi:2-dehydro-3-deoxyphosphooctonate aldolase (KDO 8-P synthase)